MPPRQPVKSQRQVAYLLSNGSPLTQGQQQKLKHELHTGVVRVKKTATPKKK